jgi:hypothetical protein
VVTVASTLLAAPGSPAESSEASDVIGYGFEGLVRNTGVAIDPSGNVWLTNNWKEIPDVKGNPGGYEIVAFVGLAGPVQPPAPRPRPVTLGPRFTG